MKMKTVQSPIVAKVLLASGLISAFLMYFLTQLLPGVSMMSLALYLALGTTALIAILMSVVIISMTVRQFILRSGGTDTQWLWFPEDPPGLVALRNKRRVVVAAKGDIT
ncbi:hypothetical protein ACO0LB_03980 [Undibacterium sp. SXout7W]|uniref:hypothetical protein n=1 Tax=Undibacterium sp. SXout7W TaxID=3413049 RepID=UPI003BF34C86